ncbi:hypothetical protein PAXRUDRAFT_825302 [Paxillus rubicundulus Ve08.2h10]|uniref:Cytochrome b mRNA-processing protein 4 n=1 Tax=Paxillus rubicundulus Ve08.2h10 TaxID=930991 RepID=A0A0D0EB33_9AGAM|nr:hypothetical protein PAXRUDRAFT_825302 [Paxillus rubicundulus Ve08.2h10]
MSFPWFRLTLVAGGLMGTGYLMMRATVPSPEQTYAALAPDLRRKVDANRAARLAQERVMKEQIDAQASNSEAGKPIWSDPQKQR